MNKSELRKYLRSMSREQMEAVLLELHGRQDKTEKEVFELVLKGVTENQALPDKKARIPDTKKLRRTLTSIEERTFGWYYYGRRRARSTAKKNLKAMIHDLLLCPEKSTVYPEACSLLEDGFVLCTAIDTAHLMGQETVKSLSGMDTDDFFRTVAAFILRSGYTRDNLKRLSSLSCIIDSQDWILSLRLQEILLSLLKNGDLRIELLDLLEERIEAGLKTDQTRRLLQRLIYLYLLLCQAETSLKDGQDWLERQMDHEEASKLVADYTRLRHILEEDMKKEEQPGSSDPYSADD